MTDFSNVKDITLSILNLVEVHRLTISMGGDGVSGVSARSGEGVGRMVNGTGITSRSIARSGTSGGDSSIGMETRIDNKVEGSSEGDRGRFGKKVLG